MACMIKQYRLKVTIYVEFGMPKPHGVLEWVAVMAVLFVDVTCLSNTFSPKLLFVILSEQENCSVNLLQF